MTTQDELRWLIDTIISEWPTTGSLGDTHPPENLTIRNRDEPIDYFYDPPNADPDAPTDYDSTREIAAPSDNRRTLAVATGAGTQSFYGNKPQYDVETTLDVFIQEKTGYEYGAVYSVAEHNTLVDYVQEAINSAIVYPSVDTGDEDFGRVVYQDLAIIDVDYRSKEYKDQYRTDFTVRLRGKEDTPN